MTILNLKPSNCWKRKTFGGKLQKNRKNQDFSDNWKHGGVIINCTLLESQRPLRGWNQVVSETKASKMKETINWKYSNPGKIQIFTFSALTKNHTYCLRILKSTGYHICLKFWMFPFDLRKKRRIFANQTQNEIWHLNLKMSTSSIWESFQRTVLQGKNGSTGKNRYRKHGWVVIRADEGAGSTLGAGGKIYLLAAHEKHESKGFDRSGSLPIKSEKMQKIQGLAITKLRFHGVVVITSASHAEGPRFDAVWNQTVLKSNCEYCTQEHF